MSLMIQVVLREATEQDRADLFTWRNDEETRRFSKNSDVVAWNDHVQWFAGTMASRDRIVWIGFAELEKAGMVRFDKTSQSPDCFNVSIVIAPEHRRKGYGGALLRSAISTMPACVLVAEIKDDNLASQGIFLASGFRPIPGSSVQGFARYMRPANS